MDVSTLCRVLHVLGTDTVDGFRKCSESRKPETYDRFQDFKCTRDGAALGRQTRQCLGDDDPATTRS